MKILAIVMAAALGGCGNAEPGTRAAMPTTPPPAAEPAPAAADAPDERPGPAGPSVSSPDTEARVTRQLGRMRDGKLEQADLGVTVLFGAGLWSSWQLAGLDSKEGIPFVAMVPVGDRTIAAHGRGIRFGALAPFMSSAPVRELAARFADGEIAAATAGERSVYYAGISWEIAGQPVTVVRKDGDVLVVVLDDEGHLFHLDVLGPWRRLLAGEPSEIAQYQPPMPGAP